MWNQAMALVLAMVGIPLAAADWRLVWGDEFKKDGAPDPAKWSYEEGFLRNGESQFYTKERRENIRVEKGVLVIEARKEHLAGPPVAEYTSGSLTTKGKAAWRYGRIEVRAKLPAGRGTWPAIWLLGGNEDAVGWPKCGEIDVMEHVGYDPGVVHANVHTEKYNHAQNSGKGDKVSVKEPSSRFHVYSVEWSEEKMEFFVDGKPFFAYSNEKTGIAAWPFDQPFYLILNVAIGGMWGGRQGVDDSIFPQRMEVDYVRVYQRAES
jgi:beta-glucanase (GH16 family)